jgi:hypothetical protein
MKPRYTPRIAALVCLLGFAAQAALAQNAADSTRAGDSTAAPDSTRKKGGLLGKMKHVAQSRVVQQVAKTAACTVVPGGQVIAGAIDAAGSRDAGNAATSAAETATGTGCANSLGNLTTAGDRAAQGAAQAAMPPAQPTLDPRVQSQLNMMNAMGMGPATDEESQAKCLGVSVEEYRLIVYPPGMNTRPPTKAEEKARTAAMKKLDRRKQQECMMQASNGMMAQVQQMTAGMQQKMADADAGAVTEAPGQALELPADLENQLRSGKVAVGGIDWIAGSASVSRAGEPAFQEAMSRLGTALHQVGGQYRLDLYMDNRYDDEALGMFGPQRLALVETALAAAGVEPGSLTTGQAKKDKHPRLEIVKAK